MQAPENAAHDVMAHVAFRGQDAPRAPLPFFSAAAGVREGVFLCFQGGQGGIGEGLAEIAVQHKASHA